MSKITNCKRDDDFTVYKMLNKNEMTKMKKIQKKNKNKRE